MRPFELERLELGIDRLVELLRRAPPRRRQRLRRGAIARQSLCGFALQRGEPLGAGIDQSEIAFVAVGQRGKLVDRHIVFASGGAQREQALLDALEFLRIVFGDAQRLLRAALRASSSAVSARSIALTAGSISAGACAARRSRRRTAVAKGGTGEFGPDDGVERRTQILGDFFRLHHRGAAFGERRLLAGLRA